MTELLHTADRLIQQILKVMTITLFAILTLLLTANIIVRFFPVMSMHWFDEIVEMCFAALVFYGAAVLWTTRGHFSVGDWISKFLPTERAKGAYRLLVAALSTAFLAVLFWYSLRLVLNATELTTVFQIPKSVLYSCMPISSLIMLAYSFCDVCKEARRTFLGRS